MPRFDIEGFLAAIDQIRQARALTWYGVFHETGVQYGMLKPDGVRRSKAMSVHTMAKLIVWSGLDPNRFIQAEKEARS